MSFIDYNNDDSEKTLLIVKMIINEFEKRIYTLKSNNFSLKDEIEDCIKSDNRTKAKSLMYQYKEHELAIRSIEELLKRIQRIFDNLEKNEIQPYDNMFLTRTLDIEDTFEVTNENKSSLVTIVINKELRKAKNSLDLTEEIIESELIAIESKLGSPEIERKKSLESEKTADSQEILDTRSEFNEIKNKISMVVDKYKTEALTDKKEDLIESEETDMEISTDYDEYKTEEAVLESLDVGVEDTITESDSKRDMIEEKKKEDSFGGFIPPPQPQAPRSIPPPPGAGPELGREDNISRSSEGFKPNEIPKPASIPASMKVPEPEPSPPSEQKPFVHTPTPVEEIVETSSSKTLSEISTGMLDDLHKLKDDIEEVEESISEPIMEIEDEEEALPEPSPPPPSPEPIAMMEKEKAKSKHQSKSKSKKKSRILSMDKESPESIEPLLDDELEYDRKEGVKGAISEDIVSEELIVAENKKIHSQVSYYDRVIPFNNYPLIVKLSHSQIEKQKRKTNILTGERKTSKDEEVFETDEENVIVEPICPGCLVSPSSRVAPLNIPYNELEFTVAPLVNGKIDGRVEIKSLDHKLIHTIEIPSVSKQSRLAKTVAIVGSIVGIAPSALDYLFDFNINDVARDQLSQDFPEIAAASSNINFLVVAELVIFAASLMLAGFLLLRRRPKKASKGSKMPSG